MDGDGVEDHVELYTQRVMHSRLRGRMWEVRGMDNARLPIHKWHRTVRFLLRQEETN